MTLIILVNNTACNESKANQTTESANKVGDSTVVINSTEKEIPTVELKQNPLDYIPKGFDLFSKESGDLNKDGISDLVLIIKGTDKSNFVQDEYRGELDRNRRGIIVLLKKKGGYELAAKNVDCFSSENEDGGVYYAPELSFLIKKGNLYVEYRHGRYGYWTYTFKYRNGDFELIGYDSTSTYGPIINRETSINFLTKRKQEKVNVNEEAESGDEVFEETWTDIKPKTIRLSEIEDFDELDFNE